MSILDTNHLFAEHVERLLRVKLKSEIMNEHIPVNGLINVNFVALPLVNGVIYNPISVLHIMTIKDINVVTVIKVLSEGDYLITMSKLYILVNVLTNVMFVKQHLYIQNILKNIEEYILVKNLFFARLVY